MGNMRIVLLLGFFFFHSTNIYGVFTTCKPLCQPQTIPWRYKCRYGFFWGGVVVCKILPYRPSKWEEFSAVEDPILQMTHLKLRTSNSGGVMRKLASDSTQGAWSVVPKAGSLLHQHCQPQLRVRGKGFCLLNCMSILQYGHINYCPCISLMLLKPREIWWPAQAQDHPTL